MAVAPGSSSSSSDANVASYGSHSIASRTSTDAESAAERSSAASSAASTKPSASSSNSANTDATRMASDSDNANADGSKPRAFSAIDSSNNAPSLCTPVISAVSGVLATASSTQRRSDAKRRVASIAEMASRATRTPGTEENVSSRLNARTAFTNEVRSVNPNTNAFARNVVKMTACAKDSTAKTPPTVNAKTSHIGLIQGATAP